MNTFIRLMHEGLTVPGNETKTIDAAQEFLKGSRGARAD